MKRFFLFIIYFLLVVSLYAVDVNVTASLKNDTAFALPAAGEDMSGDCILSSLIINSKIDVREDQSSLKFDGELFYDGLYAQFMSKDYVCGEQNLIYKIKEAWYDYNDSVWSVRIGRQICAWGKADGLTVCDILCPKDMNAFLLDDYFSSRIGIDAGRLSVNLNSFTVDAYWIPFFTPEALPLKDGSILKDLLLPSSVLINGTEIPVDDITDDSFNLPETNIANGEYAFKLSSYLSFADFSLYAFYGWDDEPLLNYKVNYSSSGIESISVSGTYKRLFMAGLDAAFPIGQTVIRMEGAFFPDRSFALSAEKQIAMQLTGQEAAYEKHNEVTGLVGIDWMSSFCTITAQYYCDYLYGSIDILDREDSYLHQASFSFSKSFFSDTFNFDFTGILEFNDFSSYLQVKGDYSLSDTISLYISSKYFIPGPEEDGSYGLYKTLSCINFGGKFVF